jgi:hypothetical protein
MLCPTHEIPDTLEGFEREGRKEFAQFVRIAKGSNGEGRALLYLAHGRGYLEEEEFTRLLNRNTRIGKMLRSLYNPSIGTALGPHVAPVTKPQVLGTQVLGTRHQP